MEVYVSCLSVQDSPCDIYHSQPHLLLHSQQVFSAVRVNDNYFACVSLPGVCTWHFTAWFMQWDSKAGIHGWKKTFCTVLFTAYFLYCAYHEEILFLMVLSRTCTVCHTNIPPSHPSLRHQDKMMCTIQLLEMNETLFFACVKLKILREGEQIGNHTMAGKFEVSESCFFFYNIAVTICLFMTKKQNF